VGKAGCGKLGRGKVRERQGPDTGQQEKKEGQPTKQTNHKGGGGGRKVEPKSGGGKGEGATKTGTTVTPGKPKGTGAAPHRKNGEEWSKQGLTRRQHGGGRGFVGKKGWKTLEGVHLKDKRKALGHSHPPQEEEHRPRGGSPGGVF